MKTKTKKTNQIPLTRNEFKAAISKLSRNELIGLLCDIYYANADIKDNCECDCGCGSEGKSKKSLNRPKAPKSKVSKSKNK
jgi:hypothetical protein